MHCSDRLDSVEARLKALEETRTDAPLATLEHAILNRAIRWRQGGKASADEQSLIDAVDRLLLARKQEELR